MINFVTKHYNELGTDELYEILKLRAEVFIVEQNCPYQDCDDKDKESYHLSGYENNTLVAYARLLPDDISYENYCSIGRVVTKPTYRNKSYGKLLMAEAIHFCKENFIFNIKISAQAYLEKFYQEFGFKTVSEPYMEDNIPHIAMIRN